MPTILITGASAGIGAACARAFAHDGARLVLLARRQDRLHGLAEEIREEHGIDVHTLALDVRDGAAVDRILGEMEPPWSEIDVLVNNAGLGLDLDPVYRNDPGAWDEMIDTNVKGLLRVTRAVVPGMVERGRGHVINLGSIAGQETYPGGAVYCATKHAVRAITSGLRKDLLGTGVRVSSVDPGMVETEFSEVRFRGDRERAEGVYAGMTPLTGEDVAEIVVFCATRPPHVNIDQVVVMPTDQASATMVHRS